MSLIFHFQNLLCSEKCIHCFLLNLNFFIILFIQVFQKVINKEHRRAKDAYQLTVMDMSTLQWENLEAKSYDLARLKVLYFSLQKFLNPHKYKTLVKFIVTSHPPVEKKANNYFIATIIHRS